MKNDATPKIASGREDRSLSSGSIGLVGMDEEELVSLCEQMGETSYRGRQMFSWLYAHGVSKFSQMTNIPKGFRAKLGKTARLETIELDQESKSADGTEKYVWRPSRRRASRERPDTDEKRKWRDAVVSLRLHAGRMRDGMRVLSDGEDGFRQAVDGR